MPYSQNPAVGVLDAIRFWLQDTGSPPLLSDPELRYFIDYSAGYTADPILLAAGLCSVLVARFAGNVNVTGDGITVNTEGLQDKYRQLGQDLRASWSELNGNKGLPYAGGIDYFDWVTRINSVPSLFAIGMNDNPRGAGQLVDRHVWAGELADDYYGTGSYFEGG